MKALLFLCCPAALMGFFGFRLLGEPTASPPTDIPTSGDFFFSFDGVDEGTKVIGPMTVGDKWVVNFTVVETSPPGGPDQIALQGAFTHAIADLGSEPAATVGSFSTTFNSGALPPGLFNEVLVIGKFCQPHVSEGPPDPDHSDLGGIFLNPIATPGQILSYTLRFVGEHTKVKPDGTKKVPPAVPDDGFFEPPVAAITTWSDSGFLAQLGKPVVFLLGGLDQFGVTFEEAQATLLFATAKADEPIDLGFFGAPGFQFLVDPLSVVLLPGSPHSGGNADAEVQFTVPNDPDLVGRSFFGQWAFCDEDANPIGLRFSQMAEVIVVEPF